MKVTISLFLIVCAIAVAFRPLGRNFKTGSNLSLKSAGSSGSLQTTVVQLSNAEVTLRGLAMTDALQAKIENKIIDSTVAKLGDQQVTSTHITLSLEPHKQVCDVRCAMKGGAIVEAKSGAENMYTSLDLVSKILGENLKRHRQKVKAKHRKDGKLGGTTTEDEADILNEV